MSGEWLALGAVGLLALAGARRGSRAKAGEYGVTFEWTDRGGRLVEAVERGGGTVPGPVLWNALSNWHGFWRKAIETAGWRREPTMGSLPPEDLVFPDGSRLGSGSAGFARFVAEFRELGGHWYGNVWTVPYEVTVRIPEDARRFPPGTGRTLARRPGGGKSGSSATIYAPGTYHASFSYSDYGTLDRLVVFGRPLTEPEFESTDAERQFWRDAARAAGWTVQKEDREEVVFFPDDSQLDDSSSIIIDVHDMRLEEGLMGEFYVYDLTVHVPPDARYWRGGRTLATTAHWAAIPAPEDPYDRCVKGCREKHPRRTD